MSIFEAKEWWGTKVGNNEEFDSNSICIENIDNETNGKLKIIVSSFQGMLRIYEPTFGEFRADNLLYEKNYNFCINQISSGSFIINCLDKQLAILTPKKLMIYSFQNLKSVNSSVKLCFEHKLKRNGSSFCTGRIGERNYDLLFVQSIDGAISIFEQDTEINTIIMSELVFPGPMSFFPKKELLIFTNTAYELEAYNYANLATTMNSNTESIFF
jgi:Bardet-Biedl syndrome 9 protein